MHAKAGGRQEVGALRFQRVLDQVRNNLDQLHGRLLGIREPSDRPALRDRLAIRRLYIGAWHTRATGFFAASMSSRRDNALRSFVRSQSGPWPHGKNTLS